MQRYSLCPSFAHLHICFCVQVVHFFCMQAATNVSLHPLLTKLYIIMNTKQALLQFVQQIMHEGIDALIDRIANRVIEKLDEARGAMPQAAAKMDEIQQQMAEVVETQQDGKQSECQITTPSAEVKPEVSGNGQSAAPSITEQAMQLVDEMYDTRYNVLDRVAEIRRHGEADGKFVPVGKLVRNTIVIDLHKRGCMVWNNDVDRILESDYMPQYHPFTSYLKSLPAWDGTDRITPLAARVSSDTLWTTVFHRWLRAMVAGWYGAETGAASQSGGNAMIPLLVSEEQGLRKSTFCRLLLPPELRNYYTDKFELSGTERLELALSRFALVNLDEFDRYSQQHAAKLKNLVQLGTMQSRRPYASGFAEMPRVASFIGTSNRYDLLNDPTGSRRFFCQEVHGVIDCDTPLDYAQLYAQLLHEVQLGELTYFTHSEEAAIQHHNRLFYQSSPLRECFVRRFEVADEGKLVDGGEWQTATAIFRTLKRDLRGMVRNATPNTLGRELMQLGVPRKRCNRGVMYWVKERETR